jgi:soluble lytic murein transglycosylase-like protein
MRTASRWKGALGLATITVAVTASAVRGQSAASETLSALQKTVEARALQRATDKYDQTFEKYSKRYFGPSFDWKMFKAQALAESGLDPNAASGVGARGLMQLMPSTYQWIQSKSPELGPIDDPEWNIAAGIQHDRYLWRLWSGKDIPEDEVQPFMFASYNAGEGTIGRATTLARSQNLDHSRWSTIESIAPNVGRWRYQETLGYVSKISRFHQLLLLRR